MSDLSKLKSKANGVPETGARWTVVGVAASSVWLIGLATYLCLNWQGVLELKPNEVGDALAGAFAPLAFLWLVLGFFQQGAELRNSGRALWLQGEELKNSVEQQRELVAVTREQLAFDGEMLRQAQADAKRAAQPVLVLKFAGSVPGSENNQIRQFFQITNYGPDCTDVTIDIDGNVAGTFRWDALAKGQNQRFELVIDDQVAFPFLINIRYLDGRSEPCLRRVNVSGSYRNAKMSEVLEG